MKPRSGFLVGISHVQTSHRSTYRTIPERSDQSRSIPDYPKPFPNHFRSLRSTLDLACFVEDRKKFLTCQKLFSTVAVLTEQCDQPGTSARPSRLTPNCIPITKMDREKVLRSVYFLDLGVDREPDRKCVRGA